MWDKVALTPTPNAIAACVPLIIYVCAVSPLTVDNILKVDYVYLLYLHIDTRPGNWNANEYKI